ncbi:MAG: DsbA family protein [Pseudomonadota bacterium]|nr:DsbA family protein [Pseudomonadota bacterium]
MDKSSTKDAGGVSRRTLLIGGAAALAVAGAAYYFLEFSFETGGDVMQAGALPDHVQGSADAPVTFIEYSSLTCPHCASFHKDVLPTLKSKYIDTGKVKYIIREFPLDNLAFAGFALARCAGPDKYYPFIELMYERQQAWAFGEGQPRDRLFNMAKQAGFTEKTFEDCMNNTEVVNGIDAARKRGNEKFGVNSTPTFFINGKAVKGIRDSAELDRVLAPHFKS